jgi:hypothetical protein
VKKNADAINIVAIDGAISAKAVGGNPVSLKVYSLSSQEIGGGVNQVQAGAKGVYIVKATTGNAGKVGSTSFFRMIFT